jgi:hypothetical protein
MWFAVDATAIDCTSCEFVRKGPGRRCHDSSDKERETNEGLHFLVVLTYAAQFRKYIIEEGYRQGRSH